MNAEFVVEIRPSGEEPRRLTVAGRLPVGRTGEGLVLADERCSRVHCELRPEAAELVVEDLGSTNGTFVNGVRITAPVQLRPGDELLVGSTVIVVDPDRRTEAPDLPVQPVPVDSTIAQLRASVVGGTVTIVFTDIVDSTAIGSELGDRRWFSLLERHDAIVRALLAEHGGTEIKHQGDGFMLSFPSARQGVCFAAALQRELERRREIEPDFALRVRVGVHTGEVLRVDGDLFGQHVNIAARVAGTAQTDEVLVSRLVHDIVRAMGDLSFSEPRVVALKGLAEPFVLYRLLHDR